ncbi:MAG: flagellin, partial [Candidatus Riflebacteria bacterium]|nr:flagellin [Candidatus Riflebacteria bacterium]
TSSNSDSVKAIARGPVSESGSYTISLATLSGGVAQLQQSALFAATDGGSVSGATKLNEISAFYDESGFVLNSSQNIYLTGNGKSTTVSINGAMSLNDLASSLQNALVSGLGLTGSTASFAADSDGKSGVMNLISGLRGEYGDFGIAGNQTLTDALGFTVARQSVNSQVSVSISDSYGNSNNVITSENVVSGLLEGIDVKFSSQAAQISGVGGIVDGVTLDAKQNFTLDLGSAELTITVAAGDWSMDGVVRSINTQIEDAGSAIMGKGVEATAVDGNLRISYSPTDSEADGTFTIKSSNAAELGIVDNSYSGFADGNIDAESRVRGVSRYNVDADSFAVKFSVDGTVITAYQTVTAATAADLKTVTDLTAEINSELGSSAKFEVINDSLTFTDYQIGNNGTSNSVLTLTMTASSTLAAELKDKFGLEAGTAYGSGDSGASLKVSDSASRFQVGPGGSDMMRLAIGDMSLSGLGLDNLDLTTIEGSEKALNTIDKALSRVSSERARMGSYMNRLEYSMNVAQTSSFNLSAAESRIRDADMALEVMNFAKYQLLNETGMSAFNQANVVPKTIMKLLGSE